LMKPIVYQDSLLVDGDLQKSWPLWRLSKNLCPDDQRVLEFRLEGDYEGKGSNAINFINTIYSCVTSLATDFIIDTYGNKDKFDYIKVNTGAVVVVDFNQPKEKREELMDIGYKQTVDYFEVDLRKKKREILKQYERILKHVKKIKNDVESNKIKQAQSGLGLLYMDLSSIKKVIDLKYFNLIDDFKECFMSNVNPASLFGIFSLNNSKLVKSKINAINFELEEKVAELESYVFKI
ncbi:MAG TPA: hypothetical protein PLG15_03285, partial [Candidatus Gastranaerophilaceae bacterium]|nr:hypothetical protein [Candidatus Gastranaerophilaceae bacterium]